MRDDQQIMDECNELARHFFALHGYQVPDGFEFWKAQHPVALRCWDMAAAAYEHIEGTDLQNCLANLEVEPT